MQRNLSIRRDQARQDARNHARELVLEKIKWERERGDNSYAALATAVIKYLDVLVHERLLTREQASDEEAHLRSVVGWPE
jgi:hypothetical protein